METLVEVSGNEVAELLCGVAELENDQTQFVCVRLDFGPHRSNREYHDRFHEHIVRKTDLADFVEACLRLHYAPGVNPHSKGHCARVLAIHVKLLTPDIAGVWWAQPDLQDKSGGATLWEWTVWRVVWLRPGYVYTESIFGIDLRQPKRRFWRRRSGWYNPAQYQIDIRAGRH